MVKSTKKNKLNIPMCTALVLLCLTLISIHMTGGLYAKYTSSAEGEDSARVAVFNVKDSGISLSTELGSPISPGTYIYNIVVNNNSEVAINYKISVNNETRNIPLKFSIDDSEPVFNSAEKANNMTMGASETRKITIIWNDENATDYMGMIDTVRVTVTATQID